MACQFSERLQLHNENLRTNHLPPHSVCATTVPPCPFAASTVCSINLFGQLGQVSLLLTFSTCRTVIRDDEEDGLRKRQRLKSGPRQEALLATHD